MYYAIPFRKSLRLFGETYTLSLLSPHKLKSQDIRFRDVGGDRDKKDKQ